MIPDKAQAEMNNPNTDIRFIRDIIDGMYDWVRVIDRDDNMLYQNKAMCDAVGPSYTGNKCYAVLGRSTPCENCISRKAVFDGVPHEKEEVIDGRIFSVMSSPVKGQNGDIIAVVEVLRDITQMKKMQQQLLRQNEKLRNDLSLARKLQCSLLPRKLNEDRLDFSFIYRPCEAIGGDFLDIFRIDDDRIGVYIADVSGHGVSASMLTVFLRSALNKTISSPSAALCELYDKFNQSGFDQNLYISVFYAILNLKERRLTYSNAGLNVCPFIFNTGRFELLRSPGIPISDWADNPGYTDRSLPLVKGDRVFLYTDGIIEIRNTENEFFGEERMLDVLLASTSDPSTTLNSIIKSATSFAGIDDYAEISDDISLALLEIK